MDLPIFAIIPAAGSASRMGFDKLLTPLAGKSVLNRTLQVFAGLDFQKIILAVNPDRLEDFKAAVEFEAKIIPGGSCRAKSVYNSVRSLDDIEEAILVIHDCARPFVSVDTIKATIEKALETGAAIAATPLTSTLKEAKEGSLISRTIPREKLFLASTPQTFLLSKLRSSYAVIESEEDWSAYTDEAMILEKAGFPVAICQDSEKNFKLTNRRDWDFASYLLNKNA